MVRQNAVTLLMPVRAGEMDDLRARLERIGRDLRGQTDIPFDVFRTLHFARLLVVPGPGRFASDEEDLPERDRCPELLVLSSNFDGPVEEHLRDWSTLATEGLHEILKHCEGYPAEESASPERVLGFLKAHEQPTNTFYVSLPGQTAQRVRAEAQLRDEIVAYVARRVSADPGWARKDPEEIRREIREHAAQLDLLDAEPYRRLGAWDRWKALLLPLLFVALFLFAIGLLLPTPGPLFMPLLTGLGLAVVGLALLIGGVRVALDRLESKDERARAGNRERDAAHYVARTDARSLTSQEDYWVQNQLAILTPVKDSWFWRLSLRVLLRLVDRVAALAYTQGKLNGIPSIHFARWFTFADHRWMLFLSNFDGSWESYLGEFIDRAATGLSAIWGHTKRFPRNRRLGREIAGASDEQLFKTGVRFRQRPTQVWYSAYPKVSKANRINNIEIYRGLHDPAEEDAEAWLRRLSVAPSRRELQVEPKLLALSGMRAVEEIRRASQDQRCAQLTELEAPEYEDVQGIIAYGYGALTCSSFVLLSVEDAEAARAWLGDLVPSLRTAKPLAEDEPRPSTATNVALSYAGLCRLGLLQEAGQGFSRPFREGITEPYRARVLGDRLDSAPEGWDWSDSGGRAKGADLLLLLYAEEPEGLAALREEHLGDLAGAGLCIVSEISGQAFGGKRMREHFGFADGISNPVLPHRRKDGDADTHADLIEPGEVLLGYCNHYGFRPFSPHLSEQESRPRACTLVPGTGRLDIGRNGSYLVLRQIEQDPFGFWDYVQRQAQRLDGEGRPIEAKTLAAKMVGRWPDGAPLATHPELDPGPDLSPGQLNDFDFAEDEEGLRCPFGAHVRRLNPRGAHLGDTPDEARHIAGGHRIVRRGRTYGEPLAESWSLDALRAAEEAEAADRPADGSTGRGVMFMCFNADIRRQFEFLQQSWLMNPKFPGLYEDPDPLLGGRDPARAKALGLSGEVRGLARGLRPGFQVPGPGLGHRMPDLPAFTRVRGGGYFFMPGIRALKTLLS